MRSAARFSIVLVTAPDLRTARRLAKVALEARLAACVNLVPRVESHFWWRGEIESSVEVLLVFKTAARHLKALEALVLREHPYDTPEFLAMPLGSGTGCYLDWLGGSVR